MNDDQLREIASRHAREAVAPIGSRGREALQAANGLTSVILQNIRRQEEIIFYALKEAHQPHKSWLSVDAHVPEDGQHVFIAGYGPKGARFYSEALYRNGEWLMFDQGLDDYRWPCEYPSYWRPIEQIPEDASQPPKPGPSPTADEDGRCTRCGCRFEDPRELTHECPPGFQLPSEGGSE